MNEMIERVARALYAAPMWDDAIDGPVPDFDRADEGYRKGYFALARAAIAAMREPTAAMQQSFHVGPQSGAALWRDMIDAVLEGNDDERSI